MARTEVVARGEVALHPEKVEQLVENGLYPV